MRLFGLIGYPLGHSFSESFFADKFEKDGIADICLYRNFAIERIEIISEILKDEQLKGLNVTIPYKQSVIPYLDQIDPQAKAIGAVNCIKIEDGQLKGFNTDAYGFECSLDLLTKDAPTPFKALVLGNGGASQAIKYVLQMRGIAYTVVSRNPQGESIGYDQLNEDIIKDHHLIINTTPLGTFPNIDICPNIPYDAITANHMLFDVVYNPANTLFLQKGAAQGARTLNGYQMLIDQALRSWEIWNRD